jgi:hypothetical protein
MRRGVLLVLAMAALSGASKPHPQQAKQAQAQQQVQAQPVAPKYAPYSDREAEACYYAGDHDAADLCAQWRAAVATEKAAHEARRATAWSIVSTVLSGLALGALIWTLLQAENALREARKANEISEQTARRQLRAYVTMKKLRITNVVLNGRPEVSYEIHNVGQTPAYELRHIVKGFAGTSEETMGKEKISFKPRPPILSQIDLGAGTKAHGTFELKKSPLDQQSYDMIMSGKIILGFVGVVWYRDIFKRRHFTTFKHMLTFEDVKRGSGRLSGCDKGNRSN